MSRADRLTIMQGAFCLEYVKDFNGTRAAQRAGYNGSDKVLAIAACRLLGLDKIKSRISMLVQERCMGVDEALKRLAEQARAEQTIYLCDDGGIDLPRMISEGKAHLVKGTKWDKDGRLIVEFNDPQSALDRILKAGGAYKDKGDSPTVTVAVNLDEWKQERRSRLDEIDQLDDGETQDA